MEARVQGEHARGAQARQNLVSDLCYAVDLERWPEALRSRFVQLGRDAATRTTST
jgi:hypothetical protein